MPVHAQQWTPARRRRVKVSTPLTLVSDSQLRPILPFSTSTPPCLMPAWQAFRKNKNRHTLAPFEYHLERNLHQLSRDLQNGTYHHRPYFQISVLDKKRRNIAVASVRDRIVHRWIYDYLYQKWDRRLDPDVWSSRKGKGLTACLKRPHAPAHHSSTILHLALRHQEVLRQRTS